MRLIALSALVAATACSASLAFAAGDGVRRKAIVRAAAPRPKTFEPYDPSRMRSGSRPGFFDLGGGTELRVSGRTRVEYQYTR